MRSAAPTTVDLLPIESYLTVYPEHPLAGGGAGLALRSAVTSALPVVLGARRYRLASVIDRRGRFSARQAMSEPEVSATQVAFLRHAQAQRSSPGRLLVPALPHRLGRATGSRATLFVAAYGIAGDDATSMDDVLAGIALVGVVAGTVGAVGALARGDVDEAAEGAALVEDAGATLDEVAYRDQFRSPRSHLRLVLTMVDNATGQVIWHADRVFSQVDPTSPRQVRRAIEKSLRRLPRPARG
ncbi:MAG TPA: hypothetical protein VFU21_33545 [Kofleriaceae bacterium]|nr:hypothetical protein [Kofleriaceae bacterium]